MKETRGLVPKFLVSPTGGRSSLLGKEGNIASGTGNKKTCNLLNQVLICTEVTL